MLCFIIDLSFNYHLNCVVDLFFFFFFLVKGPGTVVYDLVLTLGDLIVCSSTASRFSMLVTRVLAVADTVVFPLNLVAT